MVNIEIMLANGQKSTAERKNERKKTSNHRYKLYTTT